MNFSLCANMSGFYSDTQSHMQLHTVAKLDITVNRKIFVHENIHVLNVCVNKLSWVSHENILR